jgi:tetratricopeptide (TPR) repeat protein
MREPIALVLAAAFVFTPTLAFADTPPSRWDRARDPAVGDAWRLHLEVSEMVVTAKSDKNKADSQRIFGEARDALLRASAASSPDMVLRFDLGEVDTELEHYGEAKKVLEQALTDAPDEATAERAWSSLATAYAKTDDSKKEIEAYDKLLGMTLWVGERARIVSNRAEAEMRLGRLDDAIAGYKDALALVESVAGLQSLDSDEILSRWGLAVALDRAGDPTGSQREVRLLLGEGGMSVLHQDFVFFVPSYEIYYYVGLGWDEIAKRPGAFRDRAVTPRDVAEDWFRTEEIWGRFVTGAEAAGLVCEEKVSCAGSSQADCDRRKREACPEDRWLHLARTHYEHAHKERLVSEKRAGVHVDARHHGETMIE